MAVKWDDGIYYEGTVTGNCMMDGIFKLCVLYDDGDVGHEPVDEKLRIIWLAPREGERVSVYWEDEDAHFNGVIRGEGSEENSKIFKEVDGVRCIHVAYDDGDTGWEKLDPQTISVITTSESESASPVDALFTKMSHSRSEDVAQNRPKSPEKEFLAVEPAMKREEIRLPAAEEDPPSCPAKTLEVTSMAEQMVARGHADEHNKGVESMSIGGGTAVDSPSLPTDGVSRLSTPYTDFDVPALVQNFVQNHASPDA